MKLLGKNKYETKIKIENENIIISTFCSFQEETKTEKEYS